jgi:hypothetical protein
VVRLHRLRELQKYGLAVEPADPELRTDATSHDQRQHDAGTPSAVRPSTLLLLLGVAVLVALGLAEVLPWADAVGPLLLIWTCGFPLAERALVAVRRWR